MNKIKIEDYSLNFNLIYLQKKILNTCLTGSKGFQTKLQTNIIVHYSLRGSEANG